MGRKICIKRIKRHLCPAVPADREAQRDGQNSGQDESPRDAEQRGNDVLQQQAVLQQVADSLNDAPGRGQEMNEVPGNGELPKQQQGCDERDGAETDNQTF